LRKLFYVLETHRLEHSGSHSAIAETNSGARFEVVTDRLT